MGKSEKLVVLGVLFFVVLLFVWSLQSDGTSSRQQENGIHASERDPITGPRMDGRAPRDGTPKTGSKPNEAGSSTGSNQRSGESMQPSDVSDSEVALGEKAGGSTPMLLAETKVSGSNGAGSVEVNSATSRRQPGGQQIAQGASSLADPMARGGTEGATTRSDINRNGVSRARVRMQPGWDLITTAGLQGTVDPSMFLYEVTKADATWESVAKDLYGDTTKAAVLCHNNESMTVPMGPIFVPAKDELGADASIRTVEVLQGESLWQVAKRTLGKGSEWKAVWEANRNVIADPDFVAPGTILRIPVR